MKRLAPLLIFMLIALIGAGAAVFVGVSGRNAETLRFEALAQEATSRIEERLSRHMLLIDATAALFEAQGGRVGVNEFREFFRNLRLAERNRGSVGIGYVAFARRADLPLIQQEFRKTQHAPLELWPVSGEDNIAVALLFETTLPDPARITGFDSYSEPLRKAAMDRAILEHRPRATEPLHLVRDVSDPPWSFVVYAPVYAANFGVEPRKDAPQFPTGFVFSAFRIDDLLRAALQRPPYLPIALSVADADDPQTLLFDEPLRGEGIARNGRSVSHRVSVAGQDWILTFRPTNDFRRSGTETLALLLALASLALAAAAAALVHQQQRASMASRQHARRVEQSLAQKELMLQEMKHRIKNAITRILAIARQSSVGSADVESFLETFTERLRAMATAQDALTRSKWARADLKDLLSRELAQIFGERFNPDLLDGPPVELDERTTQALGLTFHELATNALKYCGTDDGPAELDVSWTTLTRDGRPWVAIDWRESAGTAIAEPGTTGFGTRLIEANICHALGGHIERNFGATGLHVRISVPLIAANG